MKRVYQSQHRTFHAVNKELISLYWDLGKIIFEKQEAEEWGKSTVKRLANDLQGGFPSVSGLKSNNLWRMRAFYLAYKYFPILAPVAQELPWSHNLTIFQKIKNKVNYFCIDIFPPSNTLTLLLK